MGRGSRETTRELLDAVVGVTLADESAWDLRARPLDPRVHPLMGADPCWTPAHERQDTEPIEATGSGRVCSVCKARRDGRGEVLEGTGIRDGDPFVCLGCRAVSPGNRAAIRRGTRPRPAKPRPVPRGRTRLTAKERLAIARKPEGPACLALCDARDRGDAGLASLIERSFALYRSGLIPLAELLARAGAEPGIDPRRPRRRP